LNRIKIVLGFNTHLLPKNGGNQMTA